MTTALDIVLDLIIQRRALTGCCEGRCGHDQVRCVHLSPRLADGAVAFGAAVASGGFGAAFLPCSLHRHVGVSLWIYVNL